MACRAIYTCYDRLNVEKRIHRFQLVSPGLEIGGDIITNALMRRRDLDLIFVLALTV